MAALIRAWTSRPRPRVSFPSTAPGFIPTALGPSATPSRRESIERLPGNAAVGHVRYSATGDLLRNVQPLFADSMPAGLRSAITAT